MNKRPAISVIIPVYNAEKYLRECLRSVQRQTLKDLEIICVNDGSDDESLDIMNEFASRDSRFVVLNRRNKGVSATRSFGYSMATGKYIAWVDADDFIDERMFETMYRNARENDSDVVICDYNFYPEPIFRKEKWFHPYNGVVDWKFISHNTEQWNKIIRKELLDRIEIGSLFDELGEGCYSVALISAKKISTIDEPLYYYRVGHESLSNNFKDIGHYEKAVEYAKKKCVFMKEKCYESKWQDFFYYIYLKYNLLLAVVASANGDRKIYSSACATLNDGKLFSGKYDEYLKNNFSNAKIFVLKTIVVKNYGLARLVSKIALRQ